MQVLNSVCIPLELGPGKGAQVNRNAAEVSPERERKGSEGVLKGQSFQGEGLGKGIRVCHGEGDAQYPVFKYKYRNMCQIINRERGRNYEWNWKVQHFHIHKGETAMNLIKRTKIRETKTLVINNDKNKRSESFSHYTKCEWPNSPM